MRTSDLADAVEAWAVATVPALSALDHAPNDLLESLPIAICEVVRKRRSESQVGGGGEFQQMNYQQTAVRSWTVNLMILVKPDPDWDASKELYSITDDLEEALTKDHTLGGRVEAATPEHEASFEPAEVEWTDGTIARAATMRFTIGEMIGGSR
jgi:hypothetical protein